MDLDKDRLAKLLSMTGSDHDAEALAAIRKANEFLRLHKMSWSDVLSPPVPPDEATGPPPSWQSPSHPDRHRPDEERPAQLPPGYQRLRHYRNALRHEPFLPRLLGFPFWILIELVAIGFPNGYLDTRGRFIAIVFAVSMLLGILAWVGVGYYLVFEV